MSGHRFPQELEQLRQQASAVADWKTKDSVAGNANVKKLKIIRRAG